MQLAVLRKSIEVAQHYVDFVQERFNRGITNELDVTLAQRELGQLQSQVAPLIARIDAARYVIAVLARRLSRNSRQGSCASRARFRLLPARIQPGLPIELLRRRPDVAEAERQLASATALIGVATAQLCSPGRGDRRVRRPAGTRRDAGGHQSDLVGRSGRRRPIAGFRPARRCGRAGRLSQPRASVQLQADGAQCGARGRYRGQRLRRAAGAFALFERRAGGGKACGQRLPSNGSSAD